MAIERMILFFGFVFGAIIGSFLNVCIYRLPIDASIVFPGSHCPKCDEPIRWYDNIPLFSYLILGGKCRFCKVRIPVRYPLVEALSGAFCAALLWRFGLSPSFPVYYALICALIVVTFIDFDHQIIPNMITIPGIPLGFAASFVLPEVTWSDSLIGIAVGAGGLLAVALLFQLVRGKEGMGIGDVKLLGMIGAFIGWKGVIFTLVTSSVAGTFIGYGILKLSGKGSEQPIPYGPFLSLGAVVYLFFGRQIIDWYIGFSGV